MIGVNVSRSAAHLDTEEQLRWAAASSWVISDSSLNAHGDYLIAVRKNVVAGAWGIGSWDRNQDGKVTFKLGPAPELADMVGQASPVEWKQGQANPVKIIHTRTLLPESSEVEITSEGNRRVQLDGWSLVVYTDGRARLQAPGGDRRLIVESAFPGPPTGSVTVRLLSEPQSRCFRRAAVGRPIGVQPRGAEDAGKEPPYQGERCYCD